MKFIIPAGLLIAVLFWGIPILSPAQSSGMALLAGYKLDPPVHTPATGSVTVTLKNDSLMVNGSFSDLTSPYFSAGIYFEKGKKYRNRIFSLQAQLNDEKTSGTFKESQNRFILSASLKSLLKNGALYIRISSTNHQQGEIRGQIPALS